MYRIKEGQLTRTTKSFLSLSAILASLLSLLLAPLALAAQEQESLGKPYSILFQTTGLPDGVSLTISGVHTNPGAHLKPYATTFLSPGPSATVPSQPDTEFTYSGFPANLDLDGLTYTLVEAFPASPFTTGASGETITVTATYTASCQAPTITSQPVDQTVNFGEPVTLTAGAEGTAPLTYQWYKDGDPMQDATQSSYALTAANIADSGAYTVTITNDCGSDTSDAATLTVNKAEQSITFDPPASPAIYNTSFSVSPSASSGLAVDLVASGSCSNNDFEVTMTSGEGVCTLTASQPGDTNYNPSAQVVQTVEAAKADQTIIFDPPASPVEYLAAFQIVYSASSGLPVDLAASGSCNLLDDVTVRMSVPFGACVLTASQPGDSNYHAAQDVVRTVESPFQDVIFAPVMLTP